MTSLLCPFSHKLCHLCTLHRGKHYYALDSCQAYLSRLHGRASRQAGRKGQVEDIGSLEEPAFSRKNQTPKEGEHQVLGPPKLKVSKPWYPFEEIVSLEDGRLLPFGKSEAIVVVEDEIVNSYEDLIKLALQPVHKVKEFLDVTIGPIPLPGG